ncbi:MAG: amino acid ABC transporter substrate-binding protein [Burkholderiales bacterium]|nr:amino acid ABC transporter substrate-binding protein [Burkholderiales bacterium]
MKKLLVALAAAGLLAGVVTQAAAQSTSPTLARIKAAKAINVAFSGDSPPFSFVGSDNKPAGYSIDLCKRVIAQIGRALGEADLKINWLVGGVADRINMVKAGRADLECANTTQTLQRLNDVDFSNLIFVDGGGLLVRTESPVNSVADLAGKKIAVIRNTTTEDRLKYVLTRAAVKATLIPIANANEGVAMLESGSADAYAGDKIKLVGLAIQAKDPAKLVLLAEDISFEPYALAIPRNDSGYRLEVNRALTQTYMSGDIEKIFAEWLGKLGRPSPLLAAMYLLNSIPD